MAHRPIATRSDTKARLSTTDAREFQAVKALCYKGLNSAALIERTGDRLSRHLHLASYCLGAGDPASGLPVHSISVGLDPSAIDAFLRLVLSTPALEFGRWAARPRPVARVEELVDEVEQDPCMTEVLGPAGLR